MSSALSLFDVIKGSEDAVSSERQMNDELLPENVRLSPEEYIAWSRLVSLVDGVIPSSSASSSSSLPLNINTPAADYARLLTNRVLFRLILYSVYIQNNVIEVERVLIQELVHRIIIGPNEATQSFLAELNALSGSDSQDWFHIDIDSNTTNTKKVSWNPQLPHPYVDMLQRYFPLRPMSGKQEDDFWIRLGYIPFIDCNSVYNSICERAAKYGHLHVLKWAREPGNDCPWDEFTCASAALNGHLEVLKWARANNCPWDASTCEYAAQNGHLEVLKWARTNGCPWDEFTCEYAAQNGHLEVLKWARANNCPWDEFTCASAALNGHLEVLKWARANGCPWDKFTCAFAAQKGHLEALKWARANNCPWDNLTYERAVRNGHLEVLKWARANNCPWDASSCRHYAAAQGHFDVVNWIDENS